MLTLIDLWEMCDTILQKEQECLDKGDLENFSFYEKIWFLVIGEMNKR